MEPLVTVVMSSAVFSDEVAGEGVVVNVTHQASALSHVNPAIAGPFSDYPLLQERLVAYLSVIGVKDGAQANAIAVEALSRARRKVAPGLNEELFRRSLEDIQRNLDLALTRALGLGLASDSRAISGARAALLMGQGITADVLLGVDSLQPLDIEALRGALPQATPPEAPLSMQEQPFSFFFDDSSPSSEIKQVC
jgi:hypothetical protein